MSPSRLHALIDGVFAIAITLLVLDLPRPHGAEHLAHDLLAEWPAYVAYSVSFVTIGLVWVEHHGMMSAVTAINRRLLERTLAFLFFITLVPWPTAIAADYADRGGSGAVVAAVLYGSTMLCMAVTFGLTWKYLAAHPQLVAEPAREAFRAGTSRAFVGAVVYVVAIAIAFISPLASFAVDALIAVFYAVTRSEVPGLIFRAQVGD